MSHLATRFGRNARILNARDGALDEDQLRAVVPSVFAEEAHMSRSDRYTYIPTIDIVRGLAAEGFSPVYACQATPRDDTKLGHTKHMLRFRNYQGPAILNKEVNEIIMINSHDGTSAYQLLSGVFRFICTNGMVCGNSFEATRVHHKGNIVDDVIDAAYSVVEDFARVDSQVDRMKAISLRPAETDAFATAALAIRYTDAETGTVDSPVQPWQVLQPRRREDVNQADVWTTFNRVQENMIRGGLHGRTQGSNGRMRRTSTRPVNGIDGNVSLNRALWTLAEKMAEIKSAH